MNNSEKSSWYVIESTPIRELINQDFYQLSDGNMKKIKGDIHSTIDSNPNSKTFGELHSTLRIAKNMEYHF